MSELIDRRQAIKAIEDLPNCYNGFSDTYDKAYIIGVLEELPPAAPRWHRVEEPPKEGQNVLTMDANEDMETATYDGHVFEDSYGFYITNVLYWMPIEPPKEEEHGN